MTGEIGSAAGPNWQSSWIDFSNAINFRQGEKLKIKLHRSAENLIVRLLPSGAHPSSFDGIVGGIRKMPGDGILMIQLPGEPITMLKPPTGEPCAGEPHARFGGRGGCESFPTPIREINQG